MVLLRLTVKVPPRECLDVHSPSLPNESNDRSGSGGGTMFLLVIPDPEKATVGMLADMIQAKWKKLRPGVQ